MERCGSGYEGSSTEVAPPPERPPMPWKGRAGPAESSMWYADGVADGVQLRQSTMDARDRRESEPYERAATRHRIERDATVE